MFPCERFRLNTFTRTSVVLRRTASGCRAASCGASVGSAKTQRKFTVSGGGCSRRHSHDFLAVKRAVLLRLLRVIHRILYWPSEALQTTITNGLPEFKQLFLIILMRRQVAGSNHREVKSAAIRPLDFATNCR